MTNKKRVITSQEASQILGVSARTVRNMINRGSLPGAFKLDPSVRSKWLIPIEDVEQIKKKRQLNLNKPTR